MKNTRIYRYVSDFSVDSDNIDYDSYNILNIHKHLMKRTRYKIIFGFILKMFIELLKGCAVGNVGERTLNNLNNQCVSLNNQLDMAKLVETLFYSFAVSARKLWECCNTINDPFCRVCVPIK